MALRTPWYACARGDFDRFDERARVPVIQKYDGPDFVERLLRDPRDSLRFTDDDRWGYPVPVPVVDRGPGRLRFATHRTVRTGLRKLYQPSHDRFYAVVVELFCDVPGLPRPGPADDVTVSFVLRRVTVGFSVSDHLVRRMARDLAGTLVAAQHRDVGPAPSVDRDVATVLQADVANEAFTPPDGVSVSLGHDRWLTDTSGRARWVPADAALPPGATLVELELPMWRLPPAAGSCDAAATRSLWFGLVPTSSSERSDLLDDPDAPPHEPGSLKLDDHSIYEVVCRARRSPPPGREYCPPKVTDSEPTAPFRLAPFFDPEGTRHHAVSITMPDLRTLSARAGEPPGPGGVSITSPPGSQLRFDPGGGTPKDGSVDGDVARVCTFALEIFMIVAFFVFSLFLPIVVFLFQLWWLLALRFCLPPAAAAMGLLSAHFAAGKTLADLPVEPPEGTPRPVADQGHFDALVGARGATQRLAAAGSGFDSADADDLLAAMDPTGRQQPRPGTPESTPSDPLCEP